MCLGLNTSRIRSLRDVICATSLPSDGLMFADTMAARETRTPTVLFTRQVVGSDGHRADDSAVSAGAFPWVVVAPDPKQATKIIISGQLLEDLHSPQTRPWHKERRS
jgi:hypothetical protein